VEQQIKLTNDWGEKLAGTLHAPPHLATAGVVFGHCFTCSRHTSILRQICKDLAASGLAALRFDFSGNGQSGGQFSESTYTKQISEMQTAMSYLKDQGVSRIGLAGHSLGAAVAVLTAGQASAVKALCTLGGRLTGTLPMHFLNSQQRDELNQTGEVCFISRGRSLGLTRDFVVDADQYDLLATLSALKIPIMVVHGEQDEIIPIKEAIRAQTSNPAYIALTAVADADHMFTQEAHRFKISRLVVEWFKSQLLPGNQDPGEATLEESPL
jgi:putative redox protein